jgi:purine-binding chemotaxis protein CheW
MKRQGDQAPGSDSREPEESRTQLATAFFLRDALCALDASLVEEVVRLRHTTPVPHAPKYLRGVMNLRGKIVSVIDLGCKVEMGAAEPGERSRVYIVRDRSELVGLLVDSAADVIEFDVASLEPAPANVRGVEGRFLRGVARAGGRLAAVLDADAVLASET